MARALPPRDLSHLETMGDVMPYASFSVGKYGMPRQLCCCGHEFQPGEQVFSVPGASWVCLACASRAFYGEDIRVEWVYIVPGTANNKVWQKVPRFWAEERGLDWDGKNGLPPDIQARVEDIRKAYQQPIRAKPVKPALDEEALRRRHRMMEEKSAPVAVQKQGLF